MTLSRTIFLMLITLVLAASYVMDLPDEQINFCLAAGMLLYEVYESCGIRQITNFSTIIQLKSNDWIGGLGITAFLIYHFSDEQIDIWNIFAIVGVLIFGGLYIARNRTLIYVIEDMGIRNLSNGKLLDKSTITNIKFNEVQLTIDTTKFQNDLIIKSASLRSPSWRELTDEILKLS